MPGCCSLVQAKPVGDFLLRYSLLVVEDSQNRNLTTADGKGSELPVKIYLSRSIKHRYQASERLVPMLVASFKLHATNIQHNGCRCNYLLSFFHRLCLRILSIPDYPARPGRRTFNSIQNSAKLLTKTAGLPARIFRESHRCQLRN